MEYSIVELGIYLQRTKLKYDNYYFFLHIIYYVMYKATKIMSIVLHENKVYYKPIDV